jgi:two-component system, OmpR family, sensor kinase
VQSQRSLLANASHELRSPLARLKMAVELGGGSLSPNLQEEVHRNVNELDALIDEILLSSRLQAQQSGAAIWNSAPEPVDLSVVLRQLAQEQGLDLQASQVLAWPSHAVVMGDARLLRRLFRNLLENALRYAPKDSVRVQLSVGASAWQVRIMDAGPGIAPEDRERVFEPFFRVKGASESHGGVGLGLALVRQIAQFHKGTVQCLARPDGEAGTSFLVELPAKALVH